MPLSNTGTVVFAAAIVGVSYTPFNAANSQIAVGDSLNAFAVTQTNLQSTDGNITTKPMDATYPTVTSGTVLTFQGTFGTGDANYAWNEWGVFNGTPGTGTMLNRKVGYLGTKTSAQTWVLQGILTVNNPLS
jgi:hypothetical protein